VNWTGVYVVDDQEQVLLELSFPEITTVSSQKYVRISFSEFIWWRRPSIVCCFRTTKVFTQTFTLSTVRGEEFTFQSPNAEDIRDLVVYFLEGLKKRSTFVIPVQDYKAPGIHSGRIAWWRGSNSTFDWFFRRRHVVSQLSKGRLDYFGGREHRRNGHDVRLVCGILREDWRERRFSCRNGLRITDIVETAGRYIGTFTISCVRKMNLSRSPIFPRLFASF